MPMLRKPPHLLLDWDLYKWQTRINATASSSIGAAFIPVELCERSRESRREQRDWEDECQYDGDPDTAPNRTRTRKK